MAAKFTSLDSPTSSEESVNKFSSERSMFRNNAPALVDPPSFDSSFSLPDVSSVEDVDGEEEDGNDISTGADGHDYRVLANVEPSTELGSTVFQNFLLCFDENNPPGNNKGVPSSFAACATPIPSAGYYNNNTNNSCSEEGQRPVSAFSAANALPPSTSSEDSNNKNRVVSLPQFLWQSDGLCWPVKDSNEDELVFFNQYSGSADLDDEEDNAMGGDFLLQDGSLKIRASPGLASQDSGILSSDPLLLPRDERSSFRADSPMSLGERSAGSSYVPRPSSTSPSLREMSKLFRTLSLPEDHMQKKLSWDLQGDTSSPPDGKYLGRGATRPAVVTPSNEDTGATATHEEQDRPSEPMKRAASPRLATPSRLLKSSSTPPLRRPPKMHRRSHSDDKVLQPDSIGSISSFSKMLSQSLPTARTKASTGMNGNSNLLPPRHRLSNESNKKTKSPLTIPDFKGKHAVKNLFRRNRLLSGKRKSSTSPKFHAMNNGIIKPIKEVPSEENFGDPNNTADVANILESLAATLNLKNNNDVKKPSPYPTRPQRSMPKKGQSSSTRALLKEHHESLPFQGIGETLSETSSLDDFFWTEEDEEDELIVSDDTDSETNVEAYNSGRRSVWTNHEQNRKYRPFKGKKALNERGPQDDNVLPSFVELARIDTAKAGNLSYDPVTDRARLFERQAHMRQQEEDYRRRINAPPVEFEAPDGDSVIRVRDAVSEIEVLPKKGKKTTNSLPPTAAEF